jgi:hypothetical protein
VLLAITPALLTPPVTSFTIVVPGDQQWTLRSVYAKATRAVGGLPNRAYTLIISDGLNTVAAVGADDGGTEPGTVELTWSNMPGGISTAGAQAVSVAPLPPFILNPGYSIVGAIIGAAAGDTFTVAQCWHDYILTSGI